MTLKNIPKEVREVLNKEGIVHIIFKLPKFITEFFLCKFKLSKNFVFDGEKIKYFYDIYNSTYKSERSVEIPIIMRYVNNYKKKNILELGNVLRHYFHLTHDVLDKYEKFPGTMNEDAVNFKNSKKYDLIISISTLEHIGWDEGAQSRKENFIKPKKIIQTIENLKRHLSPNGKLVITLPVNYNFPLDKFILEKKIVFSKLICLKRISFNNKWKETSFNDVWNYKYNYPYYGANGIIIGIIENH